MKKSILIILIFVYIINIISITYADDESFEEEGDISWIYDEIEAANSKDAKEPIINSRGVVVYDRNSGDIIWGKDENSERKMASTTKIMTAIVVLENIENMQEEVIVSKQAAGIGGSRLRITY